VTSFFISASLWITGFLFFLNCGCAFFFRRKRLVELLSYLAAALIELGIFIFVLLLHLGFLKQVPYHLPPGLPFNREEIGAALAVGLGLFPVAYWHRSSSKRIREMMAKEAQEMHAREASVRVRGNAPGEWMN
jgi:hypothetical protein